MENKQQINLEKVKTERILQVLKETNMPQEKTWTEIIENSPTNELTIKRAKIIEENELWFKAKDIIEELATRDQKTFEEIANNLVLLNQMLTIKKEQK